MPIRVQNDLPAKEILERENIFVMDEHRAVHQDIRPLKIGLLNLMPLKEDTELQLLRSFSNTPLQISSYLGMILTIVSFIAIIVEVIRALVFGDPVAGWPSLVCIITFIGGIELFCMGIMGQYIAKTYMEVKHRPHYIVKESNCKNTKKNN